MMTAPPEPPSESSAERRSSPRRRLDAAYTLVRVTRSGSPGPPTLEGHIYDISLGGVRFEVDAPLAVGEGVELELVLPGRQRTRLSGAGTVVRRHDREEVGPIRVGVMFTRVDGEALARYLRSRDRST